MSHHVIHDDVKVVGYVDDMAVMDYALRILELPRVQTIDEN